jgi:hypothetical protein
MPPELALPGSSTTPISFFSVPKVGASLANSHSISTKYESIQPKLGTSGGGGGDGVGGGGGGAGEGGGEGL